jgi:hypothetical protein
MEVEEKDHEEETLLKELNNLCKRTKEKTLEDFFGTIPVTSFDPFLESVGYKGDIFQKNTLQQLLNKRNFFRSIMRIVNLLIYFKVTLMTSV